MNTPASPANARNDRLVVDVEGARDVGPSEAVGLIRECLTLAHKRYDAAIWHALTELESPVAPDPATGKGGAAEPLEAKVARAVRRDRGKYASRFRAEFDRLFQDRRDGKPRARDQRGPRETTLALVAEGEHTEQVALKDAVQAMRAATRESDFGFDLRTRMVMRENAESGEYDNPWGATLLCDALGNACRGLWPDEGVWRPIMEHLVRSLTSELGALHVELDQLLQDRDVLPVLKVRTRKRGGMATAGAEPGDLFSKVAQRYGGARPAAPGPSAPGAYPPLDMPPPMGHAMPPAYDSASPPAAHHSGNADPLDFGNAAGWHLPPAPGTAGPASDIGGGNAMAPTSWQTLERALALLQTSAGMPGASPSAAFDPAALESGASNLLPVIDAAVAARGDPPLPRLIVDVIAAALDLVFDNPYLPPAVKTVFGRLQIPLLKAALNDRDVLANPRHPARRFFDALASASVGMRPEIAHDALFLELAGHLVTVVRDGTGDDRDRFERARDELESFLDADRAAYNQKLAQALPALLALDEDLEARGRARTALAMRIGSRALAPEVRDFIDHECGERLSVAYLNGGPDGPDARQTIELVDELLWSIAPDRAPGARKRLLTAIPRLVRSIGQMWPPDESTRVRRKVFLARLYELHMEAMNATADLPPVDDDDADPTPSRMRVPIPDVPALVERDEPADSLESLLRGDWCAFANEEDGRPLVAKFAWLSPHGTQILFTHRDGTIALIHTPQSLTQAFRDGKAKVAVEAVPLFERAMEKLLES